MSRSLAVEGAKKTLNFTNKRIRKLTEKNDAQRHIQPLWENSFEGKLHQQSSSPISIGIGIGIGRLPS